MTNLGRNHANQIRHGVIRVHENAGNRLKNAGFRRFLFAFACILDDFHTCVGFMDKSIPEALFVKTGESDSEKKESHRVSSIRWDSMHAMATWWHLRPARCFARGKPVLRTLGVRRSEGKRGNDAVADAGAGVVEIAVAAVEAGEVEDVVRAGRPQPEVFAPDITSGIR